VGGAHPRVKNKNSFVGWAPTQKGVSWVGAHPSSTSLHV